jgi:hypothetical protein
MNNPVIINDQMIKVNLSLHQILVYSIIEKKVFESDMDQLSTNRFKCDSFYNLGQSYIFSFRSRTTIFLLMDNNTRKIG